MAYKPFKMKGKSTIQGTDTHKKEIKTYKELKVNRDLEHNMPDGRSMSSPFQKKKDDDINELIEKRSDLKEKKEKLDKRKKEGKKTFLGNYRRKRKEKQIKKVQEKINVNPTAQKWKKDAEKKDKKKKTVDNTKTTKPTVKTEKEDFDDKKGGKPTVDFPTPDVKDNNPRPPLNFPEHWPEGDHKRNPYF